MAEILDIAQLGNPVLRRVAEPIYHIHDDWVQPLVDGLLATLHRANGVGIAAPQVGSSHRLLVIASRPNARYPNAPEIDPIVMINPHLVDHADNVEKDWEGCLSIPGLRGLVPRYEAVEVEYTNRDNRLERTTLTGFIARIFQHEFDHLNGRVFLDHIEDIHNDLMTDSEYMKRVVQQEHVGL